MENGYFTDSNIFEQWEKLEKEATDAEKLAEKEYRKDNNSIEFQAAFENFLAKNNILREFEETNKDLIFANRIK